MSMLALHAHGDVAGEERTDAVGELGPDPIADLVLPVIFHAAIAERVVAAALVMKRIVIGAPPQRAAADLALISRVDEIALIVVPGSPVVEDGGAPGYGLNLAVAGECGRDRSSSARPGWRRNGSPFRRSYRSASP